MAVDKKKALETALEQIEKQYGKGSIMRLGENVAMNVTVEDGTVTAVYSDEALDEMKKQAVEQSIDIVRRRIDELGTKEPQIQRQGLDRIAIQLPGVQDPSEIRDLMGKTAKMSFHLVDEETSPQAAQMGKLAPDSMLLSGEDTGYIVVKRSAVVGGESLEDARGSYDENGVPVVSFTFKSIGAKKFANATRENVNRHDGLLT